MNKEKWIEVTKEEFIDFLDNYPRPYKKAWCMITFPEVLEFYEPSEDGSRSNTFAFQTYDFAGPGLYEGRRDVFYIRRDLYNK